MERSHLIRAIYSWRVRSALFGLILAIPLSHPSKTSLIAGGSISFLGLFIRAWASSHIRKERELAVSGPYRHTRNPLYFGNFILGVSMAVGGNALWPAVIFGVYFAVFYPVIILVEKQRMESYFPRQYREYKKHVPLFLPCLNPSIGGEKNRPSLRLYLENREYRALTGTLVFWVLLTAKFFLAGF
jgi:protein-S-isoprenylcysteine O-methyltransferase Ste14